MQFDSACFDQKVARAMFSIIRAGAVLREFMRRELKFIDGDIETGFRRIEVLEYISASPGRSARDLARGMGISRQRMWRLVKQLEDDGLVEYDVARAGGNDGHVTITGHGRSVLLLMNCTFEPLDVVFRQPFDGKIPIDQWLAERVTLFERGHEAELDRFIDEHFD